MSIDVLMQRYKGTGMIMVPVSQKRALINLPEDARLACGRAVHGAGQYAPARYFSIEM